MSIKIASMNFGDCDTILHNTPNGMKNIAEVLGPNGEVYWSAIKELTGVPPLSIRSNGTMLLDYLISGNMSQTGTPSPTNPIQPQETGDRTGNLIEGMFPGSIGTTGGIVYSDQYVIYYLPVTAGETYTISGSYYIYAYYADKPSAGISSAVDNERHFTSQGNTITVISGASWIGIRAPSGDTPMVNTGSTPLPYEPYGIKIPISSAGQTNNTYLCNVQTTRYVKQLVLTGEENWLYDSTGSRCYINITDAYAKDNRRTQCYCSHYICVYNGEPFNTIPNHSIYINLYNNKARFYIKNEEFTSAADFKAYLAQQYAAGTPVTVWYVLATPTTGIVNEPLRKIGDYADTLSMEQAGVSIPTNNGSTTVDVETTLKPSQMYIKYK